MVFGTAHCVVAGVMMSLGSPGREPGDRPEDPPACAGGFLRGRATGGEIAWKTPQRVGKDHDPGTSLMNQKDEKESPPQRAVQRRHPVIPMPVPSGQWDQHCPPPKGLAPFA